MSEVAAGAGAVGDADDRGGELVEFGVVEVIAVGEEDREITRRGIFAVGDQQAVELRPADGAAVVEGDPVVEDVDFEHEVPGAAEGAGEIA